MASDTRLRVLVTVLALSAAVVHVARPRLIPDLLTAGLLLVAIVPWLAPIIKSLEITGLGKLELQEIRREAEAARGAADSAGKKAELALAGTSIGANEFSGRPQLSVPEDPLALAAEYNNIRATQKSGPARTAAMTALIRRMMSASMHLAAQEVEALLMDVDAGRRLLAYAALYAIPRPDLLKELVASVTRIEDNPFGQYWGIQAISRAIALPSGTNLQRAPLADGEVTRQLQDLLVRLPKGSDRYYELSRLLSTLESD